MSKNAAVIFAGGSGNRMNSKSRPKQFLEMNGKPIIIHTAEYFQNNKDVDEIVIVCLKDWISHLETELGRFRITKARTVVPGGSTGQQSIYAGLCAVRDRMGAEDVIVLIHDGVRPLISQELITQSIHAVQQHGSAITVTPVTETVVVADDQGNLCRVLERKNCCHAKAPQSFWLKDILEAQEKALRDGKQDVIDCATLMWQYGYPLHLVEGPNENIKITNPADFYIFRSLYEARENSQIFGL